ncbi:phosphoglucosamine mutase [Candidatus Rhodoluna planktonica]|uniref:Phosphoglucosamine mutase n=1 Tax=Candidatus Rhodoluna planktonica TaxID=535712 RepID=A0A1D9E094_9MICO|nr:phosphoglucosamine mutase [Candidatus Rhodoluna planktonica]AOY56461.1 phosphoglucosamine mutase [Candidatus Rhodoluna planktonica]
MARLFGTDGVRGLANRDLTVDIAVKLAQAAAVVLGEDARARGLKPKAVIGRDPRISGEFLAAAVSAGLAGSGVDVFDAGVLPTPATAFLTADLDADFGVMISASHNPAPDNGIKFFARGGHKLPDELEDRIEAAMAGDLLLPIGGGVGHVTRFADAEDRYVVHLLGALPNRLDGLKVVVDCAHGAASGVSPEVFADAGAQVIVIGADPDGLNINLGYGSTHLSALQTAVLEHSADLGIAHDGDADRCLAVDHNGAIVDGDQIMAILALSLKERGQLARNTLVATVMSNLGLKLAMQEAGIEVIETKVGDRYVLEEIRSGGYTLGGEQSGHVIFSQYATTGDGILTGLKIAAEVARSKKPLAELTKAMKVYPQVLVNVPGVDKTKVSTNQVLQAAVAEAEADLHGTGRVLLRASGTEPLVRVMVEAADEGTAQSWADRIARVVEQQLKL